jgi:surfeit locus 1 family protein
MSSSRLAAFAAVLAGVAVLVSLGVWQMHRLAWKRELIERVAERIHAPAVSAPGPAAWPSVNAAGHEYLRVRVQGRYLNDRETLVQAVTRLGPGFWVMTPFQTEQGYTVLINRGFVPFVNRAVASRRQGQFETQTTVIGLLRMSEPHGGFLRVNDNANDRWYSRDVLAIAAARRITNAAPYFIDADASDPTIAGAPVGGLTVVTFANNHLQYALTWFTLAVMLGGATLVTTLRPNRDFSLTSYATPSRTLHSPSSFGEI